MSASRVRLEEEKTQLAWQAQMASLFWMGGQILFFGFLCAAAVAILMGAFLEGIAAAILSAGVFLGQLAIQRRERHYRSLHATRERKLDYLDRWLMAFQSLDGLQDERVRRETESRLANVLLSQLPQRSSRRGKSRPPS